MSAVQVCSETRRALALSQFRILFFPLATESIFFGISTTMTFLAVICFFSKSIRGRHDFNLMTIICIMFAVGATHWGLRLAFTWNFAIVATLCTPLPSNMKAIQIATSNVQLINFILSDLVVVWRAWVLYDRARFVFVVSALLAIPSIVLSFTNLALNVALPAPNMMSQAVTFTVLGLSFANNLWGTSLVALKTWRYRIDVHSYFSANTSKKSLGLKALVLLTESGAIYCLLWFFFVISEVDLLADASFIFNQGMVQFSCIYPTVIVVLVYLEQTHIDRLLTTNQSLP